MTFLQRAAAVAAISFSLAGVTGVSTPGLAADVNRAPVLVQPAATPVNNPLAPLVVPAAPAALSAVEPATSAQSAAADKFAKSADAEKFNSLAEAVAAQDQDISDDTLRCLATAVYFESKSEPMVGQLAVAQVIINRTKSGRFPSNVCGVVKQRGQFSFVRGGTLPALSASLAQYRTALKIAKVALAKAWDGPAPTALYFNGRRGAVFSRAVVVSIGNHIFYR
jgi:N-acetylmuramoyl-L-alanine amidase